MSVMGGKRTLPRGDHGRFGAVRPLNPVQFSEQSAASFVTELDGRRIRNSITYTEAVAPRSGWDSVIVASVAIRSSSSLRATKVTWALLNLLP